MKSREAQHHFSTFPLLNLQKIQSLTLAASWHWSTATIKHSDPFACRFHFALTTQAGFFVSFPALDL